MPGNDPFVVLVVEDDLDARRMCALYLASKGCTVFEAADGRSGIDEAIDLRPDLIVLDLAMPRVDGWTALSRLRASSWTMDIPVVVVSAVPDVRDEVLRLGADACLEKPCSPEVLWYQIRGLMRVGPHVRDRVKRFAAH
ncbi:MAG: response regulator transcription factor [Acidobacteria bacterium]|nr:response regulator transcription factor [Acidobacteriota bacterium]